MDGGVGVLVFLERGPHGREVRVVLPELRDRDPHAGDREHHRHDECATGERATIPASDLFHGASRLGFGGPGILAPLDRRVTI
ncbi:MAG TPA: hypothetical protein VEB59_14795, partial [Gemmatimonadales bacterium]|nr:hypothetical protein [Gemmatimonadales bacterium]